MNKSLFIESIEALEKQYRHDDQCADAMQIVYPDTFATAYNNSYLQNQLVKILQEQMNDATNESWIEYYMWELDFGKKYTANSVHDNGKPIPLATAEDLWNFLRALNGRRGSDKAEESTFKNTFTTENELLQYIYAIMPFAVKPLRKSAKPTLVTTFTSKHTFNEACKHIAHKLFNHSQP